MAPRKLWVVVAGAARPTQVSTAECDNIDDFVEAVKAKLHPKLDRVSIDDITMHLTADGPSLQPDAPLPA